MDLKLEVIIKSDFFSGMSTLLEKKLWSFLSLLS